LAVPHHLGDLDAGSFAAFDRLGELCVDSCQHNS
jgi:hypothetical protein